jgi:hypothetical protein
MQSIKLMMKINHEIRMQIAEMKYEGSDILAAMTIKVSPLKSVM